MELGELQQLWGAFFEAQIEKLVKAKSVTPCFMVIPADPALPTVMLEIEGEVMNSREEKTKLGKKIRELVRKVNAVAVASVLDTYVGEPSPGVPVEVVQAASSAGFQVTDMYALGLVTKVEALVASIESPLLVEVKMQTYSRDKDGNVTLMARRELPSDMEVGGKLTGFFTQARGTAQ